MILKLGFDRGLNLGYLAHGLFDLGAGGDVAQRYPCARTGRIARRGDLVQRHVGDHPQNHRVFGRNMRPERAGQNNPVHPVDGHFVHQQAGSGVECGFRQLDRANIPLSDGDPWAALGAGVMDKIGMGAALGHRATCTGCLGRANQTGRIHQTRHAHLGHGFDDARSADAGDARGCGRCVKPVFIRPQIAANHPKPRLFTDWIDFNLFNRAGCGPLTRTDLGTFKSRSGG